MYGHKTKTPGDATSCHVWLIISLRHLDGHFIVRNILVAHREYTHRERENNASYTRAGWHDMSFKHGWLNIGGCLASVSSLSTW